jgi:hypothetical protein
VRTQTTVRLIILAAFVLLSIYRFIRYTKTATSGKPPAAIPGTGGVPPPASQLPSLAAPDSSPASPAASAAAATGSPIGDDAAGRGVFALGLQAAFTAAVVWLAANVALWLALFGLPQLGALPVIWRLVAGVLVNFWLIRLARSVALQVAGRTQQPPTTPGGNPFPP